MNYVSDIRGVSEVLGAILVFGLLIALLSIMQTQAVPAANQEIEIQHHQSMQDDFAGLDEAMSRVAASGAAESTTFTAGTSYPTRLIFFNPPDPTGRLATTESREVYLHNVVAADDDVNDYIDGTIAVDARRLEYEPGYNRFTDAPRTVYEYGLRYDDYGDEYHVRDPDGVVDGTEIDLRFFGGAYDRSSSGDISPDVRPNSAPARTVTVAGQDGNPPVISLPSDLPAEKWDDALGDQPTVESVSKPDDRVNIVLNATEVYELRLSRFALETGLEEPQAHYLVPVDGDASTVAGGSDAVADFEVRDRYNNPVSGAHVDLEIEGVGGTTVASDADGRVSIAHQPTGPTEITASLTDCGQSRCTATHTVHLSGSGGSEINPAAPTALAESEIGGSLAQDIGDALLGWLIDFGSSTDDFADITFDSEEPRTIDSVRVSYYYPAGDSEDDVPKGGTISDYEGTEANFTVGGGAVDTDGLKVRQGDDEPSLAVGFIREATGFTGIFEDTEVRPIEEGDFFVMTVTYENGERATYFVTPTTD